MSDPQSRHAMTLEELSRELVTVAANQAQIGVVVAALLGSAEQLSPERRAEAIKRVDSSVDELLQLSEDLLGLSRGS